MNNWTAIVEDIRYRMWVWPSINSVGPTYCAFQVWCFSHVTFWSYSLSKLKFRHKLCPENSMYYRVPLPIASLRQLSVSFWQHWEEPRPRCYILVLVILAALALGGVTECQLGLIIFNWMWILPCWPESDIRLMVQSYSKVTMETWVNWS